MIIDRTSRIHSYDGLVPEFAKAVDFALGLKDQAVGRYECTDFPEGRVFAMIQEGPTIAEAGDVEAHRNYMDVQIMLEGGETVYYADIAELKEKIPYDPAKDIEFFEAAGQPARIPAGSFYLALPHDGHMPCRELDGAGSFRKIVLKIRVN